MRSTTFLAIACSIFSYQASGQQAGKAKDAQSVKDGAKGGFPLEAVATVQGNASIEAVLLPPAVTKGLFGRSVSDRYAAVQVVVSNRSTDHTLIVHDVFIDYSRWLLSGSSGDKDAQKCEAVDANPNSESFPGCGNKLESWQTQTKQNQIASAEYRLPRGTLLDSAPFTKRNLIIRGLEAAGSIAAGYAFAWHELGIAKGIAAYNGNFLPAARYFFPDRTIDQANRISDFGFRVNRVVAESSSEMMVTFFPIDRFIPPSIKKLFEKSPALFFAPHALILDKDAQKDLAPLLKQFGTDMTKLSESIKNSLGTGEADLNIKFLNRLSLNTVRVIISGTMVVDASSVPASVESVEFDGGNNNIDLWQGTGEKRGIIHGRNLGKGIPVILDKDRLNISSIDAVEEGSSETELHFKTTFSKPIASGEKLTFRVDKKDKNNKVVQGANIWDLTVSYLQQAPVIEKSEVSGSVLTITGQRMFDTIRSVTLYPSGVAGLASVKVSSFISAKPTELKIDLASLNLKPACWTPGVTVGTMNARATAVFAKEPNPKIESAKKSGARVVVTGKDFINLDQCGKALTFEVTEDKTGAEPKKAGNLKIVSATTASFDYPTSPANAKWKVRVLLDKVEQDTGAIQ